MTKLVFFFFFSIVRNVLGDLPCISQKCDLPFSGTWISWGDCALWSPNTLCSAIILSSTCYVQPSHALARTGHSPFCFAITSTEYKHWRSHKPEATQRTENIFSYLLPRDRVLQLHSSEGESLCLARLQTLLHWMSFSVLLVSFSLLCVCGIWV